MTRKKLFKSILIIQLLCAHNEASLALSSSSSSNNPSASFQNSACTDNCGKNDNKSQKIRALPSTIVCKNLYQSYPVTLLSKLFSSVPKREFAIEDVSLELYGGSSVKARASSSEYNDCIGLEHQQQQRQRSGVTLLVGRSASGKSTLMRLLSGAETPILGHVLLNDIDAHDPLSKGGIATKPVILDRKPDCSNNSKSVMEQIVQVGMLNANSFYNHKGEIFPLRRHSNDKDYYDRIRDLAVSLVEDFSAIIGLSDEELAGKPSTLSPSGQFKFGIVCGCMESVSEGIPYLALEDDHNTNVGLRYPILFLDELFDFEHPDTAREVGDGLFELTSRGGIVVSATHKPHYLQDKAGRIITMSAGKILTDVREKQ